VHVQVYVRISQLHCVIDQIPYLDAPDQVHCIGGTQGQYWCWPSVWNGGRCFEQNSKSSDIIRSVPFRAPAGSNPCVYTGRRLMNRALAWSP